MASEQIGRELVSCNDARNELVFRVPGFSNFGKAYHTLVQEKAFLGLRKMVRTNQSWLLRFLPIRDCKFETEDSLRKSIAESPGSQALETDVITARTGEDDEWTSEHDRRLDDVLLHWVDIRETVRRDASLQFGRHLDQQTDSFDANLQKPSDIEDMFSITQIEVHIDGTVRFLGPCIWDEEHGFEFAFDTSESIIRTNPPNKALDADA